MLEVVVPRSQEREKSAGEPPRAFPAQSRGRKCKGYEFGRALGWGAGRAPALPNHTPNHAVSQSPAARDATARIGGAGAGWRVAAPAAWKPARGGGGAAPRRVKRWRRGGSSA